MRLGHRRRAGISSIVGAIFFVLIMVVAIASLVTIFNSFTSYNQQVNSAASSAAQVADTQLSVTGEQFGPFPPSTTSSYNVATTSCSGTANDYSTFPTNREKTFYTANMWWTFFFCNGAFQYSTSFDGVHWETQTSIPSVITSGYTVGPYFDVEVSGTTIYLAIAEKGADDFQLGIGTLAEGGSSLSPAGTITWTYSPANVVTTAAAFGPINMAIDGSGNQWVGVVQGTCSSTTNCNIAMYEHEACATGAAVGWENTVSATCSNANAPGNYAPAALAGIAENAHMIMFPSISSYSSTGVIVLYETGEAATYDIGTLGLETTTTLASTTAWTATTITYDYSLTSSSAAVLGTSLYVAGLTGTAGATTGTLAFWSVAFTSMSAAGTVSTQTTMESTTEAWQGALTYSGTTLVLFDNPPASVDTCPAGDTCIQYYESSTYGSVWSNAILLDSSETAVNGLCPASGAFAITWTNSAPAVRFAALSSFTLSNASPFSVHIVDVYVYNPATNTLVAHWYYNSTKDFDYWVGQGGTVVIPLRFIWAASTSYLITFSTDTGVTAQITSTSPPGATTTCQAGYFPAYQLATGEYCSSVSAASPPVVSESTSTNTCSDTTATTTEMMDLGVAYTTSGSSTGSVFLTLTFNVAGPATATGVTSKWTIAYGTGTAPACNNGAASGTTVGNTYTVEDSADTDSEGTAQSETISLSGLSANTAYWFDVQVVDSSAASWTYSAAGLSVFGTVTTGLQAPNIPSLSASTTSCPDVTATTTLMMGFGTTYTTGTSPYFSGNVEVGLTFNVLSPATATGLTSKWQLAYGTGAPPSCNGASSGTTLGNQYTLETVSATVAQSSAQSETVSITGLSPSTTYWFDLQVSDSSTGSWTYSNPTMAVIEEPTVANLPSDTNFSPNAGSCAITSATAEMAGATYFTTPSSGSGSVYVSYAANVLSTATAGLTSKWQLAYGAVSAATGAPACDATSTGTAVGKQYTIETSAAFALSLEQSDGVVITGLSPGVEYWFAVQVTDSSAASWTYSNPEVQLVEIMPANVYHDNTVGVENPSTCSDTTATTALMAGLGTVYSTASYGSGNIEVTLNWKNTMPAAASDTTTYILAYGTGAPPACNAAAAGTTVGQTYEIYNPAAVATVFSPSETITITGLTPGTTYWFDVRVADSTATSTTNALPTLSVVEVV